jgi:hypothetical protein
MKGRAMGEIGAILLGFVLTTVAGGWWASTLQQRSWQKQNDARLHEAELASAARVCRELVPLLDRRLYRMQRLLWATTAETSDPRFQARVETRLEEYVEVLREWNDALNTNLALVGTYFGVTARERLDGLYEQFAGVGREIEDAVRVARAGGEVSDLADSIGSAFDGGTRGSLNDNVYTFGSLLMSQLRDGLVGRRAPDLA